LNAPQRARVAERDPALYFRCLPQKLSPAVSQVVSQAVHKGDGPKQPWHRYATAKEFAENTPKGRFATSPSKFSNSAAHAAPVANALRKLWSAGGLPVRLRKSSVNWKAKGIWTPAIRELRRKDRRKPSGEKDPSCSSWIRAAQPHRDRRITPWRFRESTKFCS